MRQSAYSVVIPITVDNFASLLNPSWLVILVDWLVEVWPSLVCCVIIRGAAGVFFVFCCFFFAPVFQCSSLTYIDLQVSKYVVTVES